MSVIAVFGASGRTGLRLVSRATAQGHTLHALVRPSTRFAVAPGVKVLRGSLDDSHAIRAALAGTHAVCCVFGPHAAHAEPFCARGTSRIMCGMRAEGVRRIVCVTGAMRGDLPANVSAPMRALARFYRSRVPRDASDAAEQETLLMASGLDWTIVKPPRLTDEPATNRVQHGMRLRVGLLSHIGRDDLAAFLLAELLRPRHLHQRVYVRC